MCGQRDCVPAQAGPAIAFGVAYVGFVAILWGRGRWSLRRSPKTALSRGAETLATRARAADRRSRRVPQIEIHRQERLSQ